MKALSEIHVFLIKLFGIYYLCLDFAATVEIDHYEIKTVERCYGKLVSLTCASQYTVHVVSATYSQSKKCDRGYEGDECRKQEPGNPGCVGNSTCLFTTPWVYISSTCGYSNSFIVSYQCVPRGLQWDICRVDSLTGLHGFISSPDYPGLYEPELSCKVKVIAPHGYIINIYILDIYLAYFNADSEKTCIDKFWVSDDMKKSNGLCTDQQRDRIFQTSGNEAELHFTSDAHRQRNAKGFWIYYEASRKEPDASTSALQTQTSTHADLETPADDIDDLMSQLSMDQRHGNRISPVTDASWQKKETAHIIEAMLPNILTQTSFLEPNVASSTTSSTTTTEYVTSSVSTAKGSHIHSEAATRPTAKPFSWDAALTHHKNRTKGVNYNSRLPWAFAKSLPGDQHMPEHHKEHYRHNKLQSRPAALPYNRVASIATGVLPWTEKIPWYLHYTVKNNNPTPPVITSTTRTSQAPATYSHTSSEQTTTRPQTNTAEYRTTAEQRSDSTPTFTTEKTSTYNSPVPTRSPTIHIYTEPQFFISEKIRSGNKSKMDLHRNDHEQLISTSSVVPWEHVKHVAHKVNDHNDGIQAHVDSSSVTEISKGSSVTEPSTSQKPSHEPNPGDYWKPGSDEKSTNHKEKHDQDVHQSAMALGETDSPLEGHPVDTGAIRFWEIGAIAGGSVGMVLMIAATIITMVVVKRRRLCRLYKESRKRTRRPYKEVILAYGTPPSTPGLHNLTFQNESPTTSLEDMCSETGGDHLIHSKGPIAGSMRSWAALRPIDEAIEDLYSEVKQCSRRIPVIARANIPWKRGRSKSVDDLLLEARMHHHRQPDVQSVALSVSLESFRSSLAGNDNRDHDLTDYEENERACSFSLVSV